MAGTIIESQLTDKSSSTVRCVLGTEENDAAIRSLLRNNPVRGEVSLSFEREPNYFQSTSVAGEKSQTVLTLERERLVGVGHCSVRNRYINGDIRRVGYLSDLRLDSSRQGRFDIIRRGYRFFEELHQVHPADFYFTSITADNSRSLRLLQRGLPGMPLYQSLTDFVTLLMPVPRHRKKTERLNRPAGSRLESKGVKIVSASENDASGLADFLNICAKQHNLAASWDEEMILSLQRHGLSLSDFQILLRGQKIIGCAALWDQRAFKQTVIRGYGRRLSMARPIFNFTAGLLGTPRLPAIGSTLANGYVSPLVLMSGEEQYLPDLVEMLLVVAANRNLEFITLGLTANDPCLAIVRKQFRCREYLSRLFQVRWKGRNSNDLNLNSHLILPEVALL